MKKLVAGILMLGLTNSTFVFANTFLGQTFLFVQTASDAEIKAVSNQTNTYELTLKKISPYVTYFSNRPTRVSGAMSSYKFSQNWQKAFKNDVPNADLVGVENSFVHRKYLNYSIELSNMQYDAAKQTFHYTVHVLPGNNKSLPTKLKLHNAALFIDGVCLSCIG